jgi:hypothetical protein
MGLRRRRIAVIVGNVAFVAACVALVGSVVLGVIAAIVGFVVVVDTTTIPLHEAAKAAWWLQVCLRDQSQVGDLPRPQRNDAAALLEVRDPRAVPVRKGSRQVYGNVVYCLRRVIVCSLL